MNELLERLKLNLERERFIKNIEIIDDDKLFITSMRELNYFLTVEIKENKINIFFIPAAERDYKKYENQYTLRIETGIDLYNHKYYNKNISAKIISKDIYRNDLLYDFFLDGFEKSKVKQNWCDFYSIVQTNYYAEFNIQENIINLAEELWKYGYCFQNKIPGPVIVNKTYKQLEECVKNNTNLRNLLDFNENNKSKNIVIHTYLDDCALEKFTSNSLDKVKQLSYSFEDIVAFTDIKDIKDFAPLNGKILVYDRIEGIDEVFKCKISEYEQEYETLKIYEFFKCAYKEIMRQKKESENLTEDKEDNNEEESL